MLYINDLIAFLLEILSIYLYYLWIQKLAIANWPKLMLIILVLGGIIILWGLFLAPKARIPLKKISAIPIKFIILFLPYLQFTTVSSHWFWIGGGLNLINLLIQFVYGRGH